MLHFAFGPADLTSGLFHNVAEHRYDAAHGLAHHILIPVSAILAAAGAAVGLFLAVLLFSTGADDARRANRWLAALMLAIALMSIQDLLDDARIALADVRFGHLFDWLIFLVGPLSFIYVNRVSGRDRPRGFALIVHAAPALLLILILLPFWFAPEETKRELLEQDYALATTSVDWTLVVAVIHVLCYWLASLLVVHGYRKALKQQYSAIERIGLRWLSVLLGVNLVIWAVWAISVLTVAPSIEALDAAALPAGIYVLGVMALRQPGAIVRRAADTTEPAAAVSGEPLSKMSMGAAVSSKAHVKYERSGLDEDRRGHLMSQLDEIMRRDKPWLENDLTLAGLASRAQMSAHHLSQLLNEHIGKSFFDYINELRVAEVQRCLRDPQYAKTAVLSIALASGFNSKGSFNAAFKKFTGMTPGEFRRRSGRNSSDQ